MPVASSFDNILHLFKIKLVHVAVANILSVCSHRNQYMINDFAADQLPKNIGFSKMTNNF